MTRKMTNVITYRHAYVGGVTTLCGRHADNPPSWVPALGPVSHGAHNGTCEACAKTGLSVGDRVEAGDTSEDRDTGKVISVSGDQITVAWSSGVRTTQPASMLRAL